MTQSAFGQHEHVALIGAAMSFQSEKLFDNVGAILPELQVGEWLT